MRCKYIIVCPANYYCRGGKQASAKSCGAHATSLTGRYICQWNRSNKCIRGFNLQPTDQLTDAVKNNNNRKCIKIGLSM
jgi:hypothetical protein